MHDMLKMDGETISDPIMTQNDLDPKTSSNLVSADQTLKDYVDEMLHLDKRFIGMSKYVVNINFYWSYAIDTACAGHGFIFFNPEFWNKLSEEKRKTIIAHEIWHLMLNHLERGEGYDPDSYNQAADHVINIGLDQDGFDMNGDFGGITPCFDKSFTGMSTEQIYAQIHKERKKHPDSHKPVPGSPTKDQIEDLVQEALEGTGKDLQQQAEENEEARQEIVDKCQKPDTDASMTSIILRTDGVKVFIKEASYAEIFKSYLTDPLSEGKRTFLRPSRRQIRGGIRLKGKFPKKGRKNRLTHLVYALDVSGSITQAQAKQFLRSAKTLKETLNPALMTIMLWDTKIVFEKCFKEDEKLDNISISAGGGTYLQPVYRRVEQLNPEALIIFTDLCVEIPPQPKWETIWFVPDEHIYCGHVTYGDIYLVPTE